MGGSYSTPNVTDELLESETKRLRAKCDLLQQQKCVQLNKQDKFILSTFAEEYVRLKSGKEEKFVRIEMVDGTHKEYVHSMSTDQVTIQDLMAKEYNYHYVPSYTTGTVYSEKERMTMCYLIMNHGILQKLQQEYPDLHLQVEVIEKTTLGCKPCRVVLTGIC